MQIVWAAGRTSRWYHCVITFIEKLKMNPWTSLYIYFRRWLSCFRIWVKLLNTWFSWQLSAEQTDLRIISGFLRKNLLLENAAYSSCVIRYNKTIFAIYFSNSDRCLSDSECLLRRPKHSTTGNAINPVLSMVSLLLGLICFKLASSTEKVCKVFLMIYRYDSFSINRRQ